MLLCEYREVSWLRRINPFMLTLEKTLICISLLYSLLYYTLYCVSRLTIQKGLSSQPLWQGLFVHSFAVLPPMDRDRD